MTLEEVLENLSKTVVRIKAEGKPESVFIINSQKPGYYLVQNTNNFTWWSFLLPQAMNPNYLRNGIDYILTTKEELPKDGYEIKLQDWSDF
jgi:hypothetical protein